MEGAQESARWWTPPGGPYCAAWHTRGQAAREGYIKAEGVSGGDPVPPSLLFFFFWNSTLGCRLTQDSQCGSQAHPEPGHRPSGFGQDLEEA